MASGSPSRRRGAFDSFREFARRRPGWAAGGAGLVLISVLVAVPGPGAGPFDARDWRPHPRFRLEFPAGGALIEPFAATAHALAGAPDVRRAAGAFLVWALVGGAAVAAFLLKRTPLRRALSAGLWGLAAAGVFVLYVCFALVIRLPSWRLVSEGGEFALADLQSHTLGSHDGVATPRDNLLYHAARGYDLVAVTDHDNPTGAFLARAYAGFLGDAAPAVIPGVEVSIPSVGKHFRRGAFILCLGLREDVPSPSISRGPKCFPPTARGLRDLISFMHERHEGAVVALAWKLSPEDVTFLARLDVDGFEIANYGHPDVPDEVRSAILEAAGFAAGPGLPPPPEPRRVVLVASSDWHGGTGFARTWTAVRLRGRAPAEAVIESLRERKGDDFLPLVAGTLGVPTAARSIFAPFVEFFRYARELSALRVLFWWVWAAALAGLVELARRRRVPPGPALLACLLAVLGVGLSAAGAGLVATSVTCELEGARFAGGVGAWAVGLGLAALAGAAFALFTALRARRGGP